MPKAGERRTRTPTLRKAKETATARIAAWPSTHTRLARISVESDIHMAQIADWLVRDLESEFKSCTDKESFFSQRKPTRGMGLRWPK